MGMGLIAPIESLMILNATQITVPPEFKKT